MLTGPSAPDAATVNTLYRRGARPAARPRWAPSVRAPGDPERPVIGAGHVGAGRRDAAGRVRLFDEVVLTTSWKVGPRASRWTCGTARACVFLDPNHRADSVDGWPAATTSS